MNHLQPIVPLRGADAYSVPSTPTPIDLFLHGNEGGAPPASLLAALDSTELIRRYPDVSTLHRTLATRHGVEPRQMLVTAGADDAIARVCTAMLDPGRSIVMTDPTFEMIPRYAKLSGAEIRWVPWSEGPLPVHAIIAACDETTSVVPIVTPNNPTGAVATADDLRQLSAALPHALILVDLAYTEFADEDLTAVVLSLPNALATRTLSKARGLAGIRVGFAMGPAEIIGWLRPAGNPFAVSSPSIAIALASLAQGDARMDAFVAEVRAEREVLFALLDELGTRPLPSQANFVLCFPPDPGWMHEGLAGMGIAVRRWAGHPMLDACIRIALPGDPALFARLLHAVRTVLAPQALLLDMDGVIADESASYRASIIQTAATYDITVTLQEIQALKRRGDANNDWLVTQRLLAERGVDAPLGEVTQRFEAIYQGTNGEPGLYTTERLLVRREALAAAAARLPIAVVTGRPHADAQRFLDDHGVADCVTVVIGMDDVDRLKPDPAPLRAAMAALGVERAWMVGDTPDDARAARAAGVMPVGVVAPGEADSDNVEAQLVAGAGRVVNSLADVLEQLLGA